MTPPIPTSSALPVAPPTGSTAVSVSEAITTAHIKPVGPVFLKFVCAGQEYPISEDKLPPELKRKLEDLKKEMAKKGIIEFDIDLDKCSLTTTHAIEGTKTMYYPSSTSEPIASFRQFATQALGTTRKWPIYLENERASESDRAESKPAELKELTHEDKDFIEVLSKESDKEGKLRLLKRREAARSLRMALFSALKETRAESLSSLPKEGLEAQGKTSEFAKALEVLKSLDSFALLFDAAHPTVIAVDPKTTESEKESLVRGVLHQRKEAALRHISEFRKEHRGFVDSVKSIYSEIPLTPAEREYATSLALCPFSGDRPQYELGCKILGVEPAQESIDSFFVTLIQLVSADVPNPKAIQTLIESPLFSRLFGVLSGADRGAVRDRMTEAALALSNVLRNVDLSKEGSDNTDTLIAAFSKAVEEGKKKKPSTVDGTATPAAPPATAPDDTDDDSDDEFHDVRGFDAATAAAAGAGTGGPAAASGRESPESEE